MKCLLSALLVFYALFANAQTEDDLQKWNNEIYQLTFSDTSNFVITRTLGDKPPRHYFIVDTTMPWNPYRFWLTDINVRKPEGSIHEHHPYFHSYIFSRVPELDPLISDSEKQRLRRVSVRLRSKPINITCGSCTVISQSRKIEGFYFIVSEPVYTSDGNFAFIDLTVMKQERPLRQGEDFGRITVVYRKAPNGKWEKLLMDDFLML